MLWFPITFLSCADLGEMETTSSSANKLVQLFSLEPFLEQCMQGRERPQLHGLASSCKLLRDTVRWASKGSLRCARRRSTIDRANC